MAFLFQQKRPKTISEVVFALNESIRCIDETSSPSKRPDQQRQAAEESGRLLAQIRRVTSDGNEVDQLTAMAKEVYATDVLVPLVASLPVLDFDARRDVLHLFTLVIQRPPTVEYLLHRIPEIFTLLMGQAGQPEIHRTVCQILRECARYEQLTAHVMNSQSFWLFFQYMDNHEFEIATDNFSTFQEFMRLHPSISTEFLLRNSEYFSQCVNGLIRSDNYVAKRQSLRMLFLILKQQRNPQFLVVYVNDLENLKLIMRRLKDKSKNINFEAFQIFKLIVANPKKPAPIIEVLTRNKSKLLVMLDKGHQLSDRREDQVYQKEREYVRDKIRQLADPPVQAQAAQAAQASAHASAHAGAHASAQMAQASAQTPAETAQASAQTGAPVQAPHAPTQAPTPAQSLLEATTLAPGGPVDAHSRSPPARALNAHETNGAPTGPLSGPAPAPGLWANPLHGDQLAPRLVPPASQLQPQLTKPQLLHHPASPMRSPALSELNQEMRRRI